jgi:hypothetical protein
MRCTGHRAASAVAAAFITFSISGCASFQGKKAGYLGNQPDFSETDVRGG